MSGLDIMHNIEKYILYGEKLDEDDNDGESAEEDDYPAIILG